jgi:hypothetical protein
VFSSYLYSFAHHRQNASKALLNLQKGSIVMSQHIESILDSVTQVQVKENDLLYLTKVSYNEAKHEILAEFSSKRERIVQRHKFFPFTLISNSIEKEKLSSLILSLGFKGFSVEEENNFLKLRTLQFQDLKKISNALAIHINKKILVLDPERSFLIEKDWSYFDSFKKIDNSLYKTTHLSKSIDSKDQIMKNNVDLGFFLTKEIPFKEALRLNQDDALFLVELSSWSHLLSVPMSQVPKSKEEKVELFLEKCFFKHGEPISFDKNEKIYSSSGFEPIGAKGEVLSKIDFSKMWADLFSNNFFNIGPETRNCSCCEPVTLDSKNLLPSSLIKVRFNEDNSFFESCSDSFSKDYHEENQLKELRSQKRKEFFLNSFPVGPFFRNDSILVPLMDAKRLISEGKATLVSSRDSVDGAIEPNHELNWFCLTKESFFSKEVRESNSILFNLRKRIDFYESNLFTNNDFSFYYDKSLYSALSQVLGELPNQLTSQNSNFFSTHLARSIISIQEATLAKFKEFSENEGYRVLHANKASAFVKGSSSLKLAKSFALAANLPQPQIAGFSSRLFRGFA